MDRLKRIRTDILMHGGFPPHRYKTLDWCNASLVLLLTQQVLIAYKNTFLDSETTHTTNIVVNTTQ